MRLLPFDTETTGLPDWKQPSDAEHQPHIVQLAAHVVDEDTRKIIQTLDVIVKPEGWTIPSETIEVHGITNEMAMDVGVPEKLALEMFLEIWRSCGMRIAHNTTFDNRIIRIGTKRYFDDDVVDAWKAGEYQCTGLLSKPIMQMEPQGKYGYKMPKLVEAYQYFCGKELENAHTAIADVNACLDVYWAIQDHQTATKGEAACN